MKKIKMIATVTIITAMTVLAGCDKNKDNDKTGTVSTATGDVADAAVDLEAMPSATVLPGAGDDKDGGVTAGLGESSSDSNDGTGENKEDSEQDENGSSVGNVNQDDENADLSNSSEDVSENGYKVNSSQSSFSGSGTYDVIFSFGDFGNTGDSANVNTADKSASSIKTPAASTTTSTTAPTKVPTAVPTATPTVAPTTAAPTIKSYIILVDKKVETLVSTYGSLVLWEFEHDDPEKGYPYITSHTSLTAEQINKALKDGFDMEDIFVFQSDSDYGETYGWMLGGYVIGQEEKIVDVAFVTDDGNYYLVEDPSAGVGVYARYSINETIGCVYSDGTKVYY